MNYIAAMPSGNILEMLTGWLEVVKGLPGGKFIGAVLLFLVGRFVAKIVTKIVKKGLSKTKIDNKLERYVGSDGASIESTLAGIVYGLLMLFVVMAVLSFAGMNDVLEPIQGMLNKILGAIPNILMAGILLFIGYFLANIVKQLLGNTLNAARVDERLGNEEGTPIATSLSSVGFFFILLLFLSPALDALKIDAIAIPLKGIVEKVMGAIPNIFLAGVLLGIGAFLAKIAGKLVQNLLIAVGADQLPGKIGLADVPSSGSRSVSGVVSMVVSISIMVLLASAAIDGLKLPILQNASSGLVDGYFNLLLAVIILGAGIIGSKFVFNALADKNLTLAKVARVAVIVLTAVVALERSGLDGGLADQVFQYGIIAACFAAAVGGAIALGLGGKDFAARWFDKRG